RFRRWWLAEKEPLWIDNPDAGYPLALAYVAAGQGSKALSLLETAVAERSSLALLVDVEPRFEPLRRSPRFRSLRARVSLDGSRGSGA
ncbi:MAG: hypothetical protein KDD11_13430, partial [Acidobacteria bacterium]|nr:hypothetical protein [Acidobacteriota bacterium]